MKPTPDLNAIYFPNQFLIAMPQATAQFTDALTYVCDHTDEGAMGVIVNYPLALTLHDILKQMNIECDKNVDCSQAIYYGGPIQCDRGFVLHAKTEHWHASLDLSAELTMTTSRDILEAMAKGEGPQSRMVFLGYSAWEAGQLENEVADNKWLNTPVNHDILFDIPYQKRRDAAAQQLGVNLDCISHDTGHS